jgi:predicted XRE-type DNA-binding protein
MEIRRRKLDRFSLETLIRYLARLGRRVELRITER